jgi:molybdate transport system substrate-binding protein
MKVLISGGFSGPYEQLVPEFERSSGIKVDTGSGSSQGSGPQTIKAQLARGVPADVVIMSREGLTELIAERRIAEGTDVDLARTPIGVAVRAGAPKPDVRSVEAAGKWATFRQATCLVHSLFHRNCGAFALSPRPVLGHSPP